MSTTIELLEPPSEVGDTIRGHFNVSGQAACGVDHRRGDLIHVFGPLDDQGRLPVGMCNSFGGF